MNNPICRIYLEEMDVAVNIAIKSINKLSTHILEENNDDLISVKNIKKLYEKRAGNKLLSTHYVGGIRINYNTDDDPTYDDDD